MQSGSPIAFWSVHNATVDHAGFVLAVAKALGCPGGDAAEQDGDRDALEAAVSCIRGKEPQEIVAEHWNVSDTDVCTS